jgi:MFS family permease
MVNSEPSARVKKEGIPKTIWILGFVSLLMDISAEMVNSLLPLYMVTSLGVSVVFVGVIEGIGQSTALIVKVFSGAVSDHLKKRKPLVVVGYMLSAFSKPFFPLATGLEALVTGKILDRLGKGIREAPRDALITEIVPAQARGEAFGLQKALDTVGAVLGPLVATALLFFWFSDIGTIFWIAVLPGLLAVLLLIWGVREPKQANATQVRKPFVFSKFKVLSAGYWWITALGAAVTLARFSEAFLLLRAQQTGIALAFVPLVMVIMSLFYALSAYPSGKLADRMDHTKLLGLGLVILLVADLLLAVNQNRLTLFAGVALWGVHMGMTQGLLSTMIAAAAPDKLLGTAFGVFNLVSGVAMLLASVLAGVLWESLGASSTFFTGATLCLIALALIWIRHRRV